jgi:cytochrome c oxidase subunit 2
MQPRTVTEVDSIFILIISIAIFFLLLVAAAMVYFVIKYNRKKNPVPSNITGNTTLEILWTVIPLALVMVIFYYGWIGFKHMREIPPDAMVIKVTGSMWKWSFEYDNKKQIDSTLYVPVGKPIKMEIYSSDVNHSFYLPAFRIKEDAIPGRMNYLVFHPTEIGTYQIMCAEYCGMNHAYMLAKLIVLPQDEFWKWYSVQPVTDTTKTQTQQPADTTKK